MKYLRRMHGHNTIYEIEKLCHKLGIENYTINSDDTISVIGSVSLRSKGLNQLPLSFDTVTGNFDCHNNSLNTLKGAPRKVNGNFECSDNHLTSLKYGPTHVGGSYLCSSNNLTSLEYLPQNIYGINCSYNDIIVTDGFPSTLESYSKYSFGHNPIHSIMSIFPNYGIFMQSLDYSYIRGNKILLSRFKEACEEFDIDVPDKVDKYDYI